MSNEKEREITTGKLDLAKKAQVVKWLNDHHEYVQGQRPAYTKVAKMISEELGFHIHNGTLAYIARAFGISWQPIGIENKGLTKNMVTDLCSRVESIEKTLRETALHQDVLRLSGELSALRGLVTHLYIQLGAKAPPGVHIPGVQTEQVRLVK